MAIKLSGSNAATLAQGYLSNTGGPWTIMFWVKQVSIATTNDYQVCIYKDTNNQLAPIFGFIANKYEFFTVGGSGGNLRTSSDIAPGDTNWHHIAYRKTSGTAAWDKFLDGVKTSINASIAYTTPTGMTNIVLGGDVLGTNLSDAAFFRLFVLPQLISDADIALEAAAGYPSITFGANDGFWWLKSDGLDSSGNGHNFTIPSDATVVTDPPRFLFSTSSDSINNLEDSVSSSLNLPINYGVVTGDNLNNYGDSLGITGPPPNYFLLFGDNLANIQDSPRTVIGIIKNFSDSVNNLVDVISKMVGIPIGAFDSLQFNWLDSISTSVKAPLTLSPSDSINNYLDAVLKIFGNVKISVTAADTINLLADTIRLWNVIKLALGDNAVISDSINLRFAHLLSMAELLPAKLDGILVNKTTKPAFSDSVNNLNDSVSIALTVNLRLSKGDTVNLLSDSISLLLSTSYSQSDIQRIRRYLGDTQSS